MTSTSFVPKPKTPTKVVSEESEDQTKLPIELLVAQDKDFFKGLAKETNEDSSTDESSNDSEEEDSSLDSGSKPHNAGYLLDTSFTSPAKQQLKKKSRGTYQKKYKTEMCHNFEQNGFCEFGTNCSYAHYQNELQKKTHVPTNFKTKCCSKYHYEGYCKYGNRCQFIHTLYYPTIEGYENHKLAKMDVSYTNQWAETERVIDERNKAVGDDIESGHYPSLFSGKRLSVFAELVDEGEKEKVQKEKSYQARRRKVQQYNQYHPACRDESTYQDF